MTESDQIRMVTGVVTTLNKSGSWTGRMHIQKFVYFAQSLLGVLTGYDFVLYQRGPYSFGLDADIRELRSIGAVDIRPTPPYGPTYFATESGSSIAIVPPIGTPLGNNLHRLAEVLGPRAAKELELLATTYFVMNEGVSDTEEITARVLDLKPHFDESEARAAITEVEELVVTFR